jgi:hypothetical protein
VHTVPSSSLLIPSSLAAELSGMDLLAANDSNIAIISKAQRSLHSNLTLSNTYVTPSISQDIVSPQLLMCKNNSSILFTNEKAYIFPNNFKFDKLKQNDFGFCNVKSHR